MTASVPGRLDDAAVLDLPKVSLHDHLDGAVRPLTLLELGSDIGLELPADDVPALRAWFAQVSRTGSLVDYLKSFELTVAVSQTPESLRRIAREYVEDLDAENVFYGEVRWAPELFVDGGLTMDQAVGAVQAGLADGMEAAGHRLEVTQILSAMRNRDGATEVARLALARRDAGVVGFDIAGPEAGFLPARFKDAFDLLHRAHFPVTVHAGEGDGLVSIDSALHDGRALRLGHGVRIAEDITWTDADTATGTDGVQLGALASWVRDRHVPLETSPTSNLHTGVFAAWGDRMEDHPFDLLYRTGFTVTVNTDNRLMSDTTLTKDFMALRDAFGYGLDDFEHFTLNAAEASFLSLDRREDLVARVRSGYAEARQALAVPCSQF